VERFEGKAHLPGTKGDMKIGLDIDWGEKDVTVHLPEIAGPIKEWPGLVVQTFGPEEEIAFRTKGIPSLFTHWWHFSRGEGGALAGIVLAPPDAGGVWRTCLVEMERTSES
jgi:hypothetical protein